MQPYVIFFCLPSYFQKASTAAETTLFLSSGICSNQNNSFVDFERVLTLILTPYNIPPHNNNRNSHNLPQLKQQKKENQQIQLQPQKQKNKNPNKPLNKHLNKHQPKSKPKHKHRHKHKHPHSILMDTTLNSYLLFHNSNNNTSQLWIVFNNHILLHLNSLKAFSNK